MPAGTKVLAQAGRALARRPLYALVAIATVAAGIAASTATFVLVDAALLSPLPYEDAERLATVDVISDKGHRISISVPMIRDFSDRSRAFESTAATSGWTTVLSGRGPARVVDSRAVYGDLFGLFGLEARLGRTPTAEDARRGSPPIALMGDSFWRQLGADPAILGQALTLDGRSFTVIGVLPPGAGYPTAATDVYLPLGGISDELPWEDRYSSFGLRFFGRLKPGVDLAAAQADLDRIVAEIRAEEGGPVPTGQARSLADYVVGSLRQPLLLLLAAAALVVLLAVANVVHLFLARAEARRAELAVRAALGAPGWDLARLQLAESIWIAFAGAALGVGGAAGLLSLFGSRVATQVPQFVAARFAVGPAALGFALLLAAAVTVALALVPMLFVRRGRATEALHGVRGGTSRGAARLRTSMVVAELALGTVLVVGATLLATSLERLRAVDKGFDAGGVVTGEVAVPQGRFEDAAAWLAFEHRLLDRAAAAPGVDSASLSLLVPLSGSSWERRLTPEGQAFDPHGGDSVLFNIVSPDWFATFGVPLLRGRTFTDSDRDGAELVTVIDESLAARYFPGEDPIGKRVSFETLGNPHDPDAVPVWRTVVGVAKNVRHYELQSPSRIQVYVPLDQTRGLWGLDLQLAVRTSGAPGPFVPLLGKLVAEVDPEIPISNVMPLAGQVERALAQPALLARTVSALASLALLLAGVGVFALASFGVAQRLREIGIRQALGAAPAAIVRAVVGQGLRWSCWGAAIGLLAALGAASVARSLLWGVAPFEPLAYLGPLALLAALTLLACATPALRAARIDPATILRDET